MLYEVITGQGNDKIKIVSLTGCLITDSAAMQFNNMFYKGKPMTCAGFSIAVHTPESF